MSLCMSLSLGWHVSPTYKCTRLIHSGHYYDPCGALPFAGSVFWVWGTLCYQGCWQPCATAGTLLCGRAPSWPATSCGLYWPTQLAFVSPTWLSCFPGLEGQGSQPWFGSYLLCSELLVCQDCAGVIWVHYGGVGTCWKCLNTSARQTKKQKGWCPRSRDHWCSELRPLRKLHNNLISWRQALVKTSINAHQHYTRGLVGDQRHIVFENPTLHIVRDRYLHLFADNIQQKIEWEYSTCIPFHQIPSNHGDLLNSLATHVTLDCIGYYRTHS